MAVKTAPVTLLWGEDAYLVREAALAILGGIKATEVDAAEWQGGELQGLATPSLFGEPRALLVNDAKSLRKETLEEISRYLEAPDPDATLVLACVVADRGKVPAGLQKLVVSIGEIRKVDIARKELEPWLVARAKQGGLDLAIPGARALVETLGPEPAELLRDLAKTDALPGEHVLELLERRDQLTGLGTERLDERPRSRDREVQPSLRGSSDEPRLQLLAGDVNLADLPDRCHELLKPRGHLPALGDDAGEHQGGVGVGGLEVPRDLLEGLLPE